MTILAAVLLPMLIGVAALVVEFGGALLTRIESQRVADLAVYAAASAYNAGNDTTKMVAAAQRLAGLNGVPASEVTAALATSPRGSGNTTVHVTIATANRLVLAQVLGFHSELQISASSYAEITAQANGCIIALSGSGTGVTLSGGVKMSAPNCGVSSNASVVAPCGTKITTKDVTYNTTAPTQGCAGAIEAPSGQTLKIVKKETADPLAGDAGVATATGRLSSVALLTATAASAAPAAPSVTTGKDIEFGWSASDTQAKAVQIGCTAAFANPMWTLTCPANGNYKFGKVTVGGGLSLKFNVNGTGTTYSFSDVLRTAGNGQTTTFGPGTYNFAKGMFTEGAVSFGAGLYNIGPTPNSPCWGGTNYSICHVGSTLTFGAGTFNLSGGIFTGGSTNVTFGAGPMTIGAGSGSCSGGGGQSICHTGATLTFGAGAVTMSGGIYTAGGTTTTFGVGTIRLGQLVGNCSNVAGYSICHNGTTLTFGGPSTFLLTGGVYNNGGSTLNLGSGSTNSYRIGPNASGDALVAGGGSKTTFADASGGLFELVGNLNVTGGGGSCMTLPATAQHDIKGYFSSSGGTTLGAGVYTVTGYAAFGANGGGSVSCNGSNVGVKGTGVSLIIGAANKPASGECLDRAFCLSAGYTDVVLSAPSSGTTAKLVIVGPTTGTNAAGALFAGGANATMSGAFYFPKGPILMSGGAALGNGAGTGQCLQIIATQITQTGGTTAGSLCFGATSAKGGVALVQ